MIKVIIKFTFHHTMVEFQSNELTFEIELPNDYTQEQINEAVDDHIRDLQNNCVWSWQ